VDGGATLGSSTDGSVSITPLVSGDGDVVMRGSGLLTLSGNNTYTGTTTVSSGTLLVNGSTSGQGPYSVADGGTLGGSGTIGLSADNSVTLQNGSAASPGDEDSVGTLDVAGGLIVGDMEYVYQFDVDGPDDEIASVDLTFNTAIELVLENVGSSFPSPSDTFVLFDPSGTVSGFNTNDFTFAAAPGTQLELDGAYVEQLGTGEIVLRGLTIPEPGSGLLFLAGLALLLRYRQGRLSDG
jgi:autotransporter-associated beta strand protein